MPRDVPMAAIVGAHGLKGEVRVKCFARTPESLGAYGPLHDGAGRTFTLQAVRNGAREELLVAFAEVKDRTAAEALKGVELFVDRKALPQTGREEFYHADLIGLLAVAPDGAAVGKVSAIHNFGAGDILEIVRPDGRTFLLAFTKKNAPEIDVSAGRMIVTEPGEID